MSSSHRDTRYWLSAWLPVVLGVCVIVIESTQYLGADRTSRPLRALFEFVFGHFTDARWNMMNHYIRKCGHFFGYGVMGLLWLRAWWMTLSNARFIKDALLGLLATAILASIDEYHQTLIPNRTGSMRDVLLDCTGAVTVLLIAYFYTRIAKPARLA